MGDFRSFQSSRRAAARPMEPVVDPAGWSPEQLRDVASWSYRISEAEADELAAGIAAVRRQGVSVDELPQLDAVREVESRPYLRAAFAGCWV